MAEQWWGLYRRDKWRAQLFQKNVPTVAGISNVNMTGSWADAATEDEESLAGKGARVLDYVRVSPTGPLLPLVFTLTTIGQRLSLCVTYRKTAFTREQAEEIVAEFTSELARVAGN